MAAKNVSQFIGMVPTSMAAIVNSTDEPVYDVSELPSYMQFIMILMYGTISVLAIGGNAIVCYIILAYQRMRTVTNYFIVNLAFSDIAMAMLCIPFDFVANQLLNYWPFGDVMCPVVTYVQAVSVFVSSYTMVAISCDRFVAIIFPLRPRMTEIQAKLVIALIWLISLVVPSPIAVKSRTQNQKFKDGVERARCVEQWPDITDKYRYSWALTALQYFLPLLVLTAAYTAISYNLWGKKVPGEAENLRDQRLERSKRKMIKMMITVVVMFALLWLPLNLLLILGDLLPQIWSFANIQYVWFVCHWLGMSHSCCNPFIYCYMNSKFRNGFRYVFRFLPCCRLPTGVTNIELHTQTGVENGVIKCSSFSTHAGNPRTAAYTAGKQMSGEKYKFLGPDTRGQQQPLKAGENDAQQDHFHNGQKNH